MGSDIRETEVPFDIDRPLTQKEIEQMIFYCTHDVEETIKIFLEKIDDFNAMFDIIKAFPDQVNLGNIGDSEARITAKVLGCQKQKFNDEFDFFFLDCLDIQKYANVIDWFQQRRDEMQKTMEVIHEMWNKGMDVDDWQVKHDFYKQNLTIDVAGIPHTFGFGGLHGAVAQPCHRKGAISMEG